MKKKLLMRLAAAALAVGMCLVQRSAIKMYRKWIGIIWLLRAAVNY